MRINLYILGYRAAIKQLYAYIYKEFTLGLPYPNSDNENDAVLSIAYEEFSVPRRDTKATLSQEPSKSL